MQRFKFGAAALVAMLLFAARPGIAQTITFGGLGLSNGASFTSYSEAGFNVDLISGFICAAQGFGNPVPDLFGGSVCNTTTTSTLRITRSGGGTFNFLGTDLSSNNGSSTYLFQGFLASISQYSSGTTAFSIGFPNNGFAFYGGTSPGTGIDELWISLAATTATSYNVDNIQTSTVPEPASMTLLATGLAGMVGAGMKRRRKKA